MGKMSMSHEDYLEAIVMLGGTVDRPVRSVDIASKLGVSKASVSKAISLLRESGYVVQPYYGDVTLTEQGFQHASKVYERHQMLTSFLANAVGIDPEVAQEEACLMEHAISDESFELWKEYIKKLGL